jgi:hypothetical protein
MNPSRLCVEDLMHYLPFHRPSDNGDPVLRLRNLRGKKNYPIRTIVNHVREQIDNPSFSQECGSLKISTQRMEVQGKAPFNGRAPPIATSANLPGP